MTPEKLRKLRLKYDNLSDRAVSNLLSERFGRLVMLVGNKATLDAISNESRLLHELCEIATDRKIKTISVTDNEALQEFNKSSLRISNNCRATAKEFYSKSLEQLSAEARIIRSIFTEQDYADYLFNDLYISTGYFNAR